ncbi:MAG: hypothetical protein R3244_05295 [Thermoanaerobaculia bacterium]|nr:hypothetical protein [Thermoanaerobaculia bacterium]
MAGRRALRLGFSVLLIASVAAGAGEAPATGTGATDSDVGPLFATADRCIACHDGLTTPHGVEVSFGSTWRSSMMANAARDPYWQAAVRREVLDHPESAAAIENECSACHMPMARFEAKASGRLQGVFAHLPVTSAAGRTDRLAADGVSCSLCHQIGPEALGTDESFTAGFVVDTATAWGERSIFGPFEVDPGRAAVMRSAAEFHPRRAEHVQTSELCATCHTLSTHTLGEGGRHLGSLPEQMPYLEWRHSAYRGERSCQSCHMPTVDGETPVSAVLGVPRHQVSRHVFRGGNFFLPRLLDRYRDDLGVEASPDELAAAAARTVEHLQAAAARVHLEEVRWLPEGIEIAVVVENLAGHKLPTAYPSRRAWLHLVLTDAAGRTVFESGAFSRDGSIEGNDNDGDAASWEPHYERIRTADEVQIYEAILLDVDGEVTTGLLSGLDYGKDNRLLPRGFDPRSAPREIAIHGRATSDDGFAPGSHQVLYSPHLGTFTAPLRIDVELWYQPIGYRWAENLASYEAAETARFVAYYRALAADSAIVLARDSMAVESRGAD